MVGQLARRRFTADEYEQMIEAGILTEDDKVELLEGEIVQMAAVGNRHAECMARMNRAFYSRVSESAIVVGQNPIRLDDHSEPEPDIAIYRYRSDLWTSGHPRPVDALILVEVADTSTAHVVRRSV